MDNYLESEQFLFDAKQAILERDQMSAELEKLKSQEKKLSKNIASEEKSISDEIASTVKKRRRSIVNSYDKQLDSNREQRQNIEEKKDKKKQQKMDARFEDETKHIRKDNRRLQDEMQNLLRKERVPKFVGSKLYFILFMPRGLNEVIKMIIGLVLWFGGLPVFITLLFKSRIFDDKLAQNAEFNMAFWCMLVLAVFVILQIAIYFLIYKATRLKHQAPIKEARSILDKMNANNRRMKAIRNSIEKDKDESQYKLDSFDEKIAEIDAGANEIGKRKIEALQTFDEQTKEQIEEEIKSRRLKALEEMKLQKQDLEELILSKNQIYQDKLTEIADNYASRIGQDLCKVNKINAMISLMEDGQAGTVSEAVGAVK